MPTTKQSTHLQATTSYTTCPSSTLGQTFGTQQLLYTYTYAYTSIVILLAQGPFSPVPHWCSPHRAGPSRTPRPQGQGRCQLRLHILPRPPRRPSLGTAPKSTGADLDLKADRHEDPRLKLEARERAAGGWDVITLLAPATARSNRANASANANTNIARYERGTSAWRTRPPAHRSATRSRTKPGHRGAEPQAGSPPPALIPTTP